MAMLVDIPSCSDSDPSADSVPGQTMLPTVSLTKSDPFKKDSYCTVRLTYITIIGRGRGRALTSTYIGVGGGGGGRPSSLQPPPSSATEDMQTNLLFYII